MFDISQPFPVKIFSGGEKTELLRWPTDDELIERTKKLRHVRRSLGRGRAQWETINEDTVNADLFEKLRVEKSSERTYDSAEATKFIDKLLAYDVLSATRIGDDFEIELAVTYQKHPVKHHLRMPTQRQMNDYSKQSYKAFDTKGGQDIRVLIEPAAKLWDNLQVQVTGYSNGHIPINHKSAAVTEVIDQIRLLDEGDDPEA